MRDGSSSIWHRYVLVCTKVLFYVEDSQEYPLSMNGSFAINKEKPTGVGTQNISCEEHFHLRRYRGKAEKDDETCVKISWKSLLTGVTCCFYCTGALSPLRGFIELSESVEGVLSYNIR